MTEGPVGQGPLRAGLPGLAGPANGRIIEDRVNTLSFTIAAGTSQIQRNILAERALGLPKEPRWT